MTKFVRYAVMAAGGLLISATAALAGPSYTFATSEGVQPSNVGTITLTQINATTVDVLVDLADTTLPLPEYGFLNSGGPHTPFAFNLAGTESGISATFIQPSGGTYAFGMFSLSTTNGDATPFGTFGISINDSAGNGSGKAYYGDLEFKVTRTSGLSTDAFVLNDALGILRRGPYRWCQQHRFTGVGDPRPTTTTTQADPVPEPASIALLGVGLGVLGLTTRRRCSA